MELPLWKELDSEVNPVTSPDVLDTGNVVALAETLGLLLGAELVIPEAGEVLCEEAVALSDPPERLLLIVEVTKPVSEGLDRLVEVPDKVGVLLAEALVDSGPVELVDVLEIPLLVVTVMNPELV